MRTVPSAVPAVAADDEPRLRTVMQYAGGKTFVAPLLAEVLGRLPEGTELREPFCGGASVSIHMLLTGRASRVWLNDADPVVQAVWNSVISEPDALCAALDPLVHAKSEFVRLQKQVNKGQLAGVELAAAAIYVQKTAFNSVYKGAFRLDSKWDLDAAKERVVAAHELLKGKVIHDRCTGLDALEVIRAPGEAVLFIDPPYWTTTNGMYRKHYRKKSQFEALAAALQATPHPWIMTIGDDEVSNEMNMPGAAVYKIRSNVCVRPTTPCRAMSHPASLVRTQDRVGDQHGRQDRAPGSLGRNGAGMETKWADAARVRRA